MRFFAELKNWADAEKTCVDKGGHLATIGTQVQNDWITKQATTTVWHGATDQFSEGTWTDSTGQSELPFSNWHRGGPNGGTGKNCGSTGYGDPATCSYCGQWNDGECRHEIQFVCGLGNGAPDGKEPLI